jgi:hypothetical protein
MKRSMAAAGRAASWLASLTGCALGAAAPPDHQYVKVEIRGQLLFGTERTGGRPGTPVIHAEGLTFDLEFKGHSPPPETLNRLTNQTVVVRGTLRKQGRDRLVCLVEGEVQGDTRARRAQYLVGYQEGQHAIVEAFARQLGLKVVDRYQPGKYLILEPTEKVDVKFIDKLKQHRAVRYVEKNMDYRIPEKNGAGPG